VLLVASVVQLLGFAQRIDSGLTSLGAPSTAQHSSSTTSHLAAQRSEATLDLSDSGSDTGLYNPSYGHPSGVNGRTGATAQHRTPTGAVYSGAIDRAGMKPDLFGQRSPSGLRERVTKQMLRKGSGRHAVVSGNRKQRMHDVVQQYVS
jgi:hypothetical protein